MSKLTMAPGRRQFLLGAGAATGGVVLLGPLAGCGDDSSTASDGSYSGELAVSHLTAVIGPAPIHIALAEGYFEDEGLDLTPVSFPGGSDTIRGMSSGMDIGEPATLAAIVAYSAGQSDLRLVSGCFNGNQVLFIAPADSPIDDVGDLAGRSVGVSGPSSITSYFADLVVREEGLEDVEVVNVGGPPDTWTAATQGVVDVAWSSPPLSSTLIQDGEAKLVFHTKDYVESWSDQMIVSTQGFIDDNPEVVQGFVTAIGRACDLIRDDTDAAADIYAEAMEVTPDAAKAALEDPGLDSWTTEIDEAGVQANADAAADLGQLESEVDVEDMIVRDFVS